MNRQRHKRQALNTLFIGLVISGLLAGCDSEIDEGPAPGKDVSVTVDTDDLGGVVTSNAGPEAGVWVIAETSDLPTRYTKIAVTDDKGRFVIPDLPDANYRVWVRGYGLVDSTPVQSSPGQIEDLKARTAPSAQAAAEYYPANYWYSLIDPPAKSEFPGLGVAENGIGTEMKTQTDWLYQMTENCVFCHQVGSKATRTVDVEPAFDSSEQAWVYRVFNVGDPTMSSAFALLGHERAAGMFANWTDRIAAGEVPREVPPRPSGEERNVVITLWDWALMPDGTPKFVHDEISTDQRDPSVNAGGKLFGVAQHAGRIAWLDPETHTQGLSDQIPTTFTGGGEPNSAEPHNPMMDSRGRIWSTTFNRNPDQQPDWCKPGSDNPYAKFFPMEKAGGRPSQVSVYAPKTEKMALVDTCFGSHHLQFGYDENETLYLSGDDGVMGWVETKVFDETGDAEAAVGWCPMIIDTNGNGKMEVGVDESLRGFLYGLGVNPKDDSVWYAYYTTGPGEYGEPFFAIPGGVIRMHPGDHPPQTCSAELYAPPVSESREEIAVFNPRGVDVGSDDIAWVAFGSGHLGKFDRRLCSSDAVDSAADGQHCPEGWTFYQTPGPNYKGIERGGSADFHYLVWVDEFNTLGLGLNVPIIPGTNSDSLIAFLPEEERFVVIRVPYPMGFYARGLDGRMDNAAAGWKGRSLWSNYASAALSHVEGGEGGKPVPSKAVKVQYRPHPLAK